MNGFLPINILIETFICIQTVQLLEISCLERSPIREKFKFEVPHIF